MSLLRAALAAAVLVPLLAACGLDFYWQGIAGQAELLARARPIDEVLASSADGRLTERLRRAREIRAFATHELGLPDNGSYKRYTDLGRPFVVWNVFAAPPLSLTPRQWCFPVAGCVSYRGYFNEADARAEAARLKAEGDDVHVGGVPAYSTLGWFNDPLLSSFVRYPDTALARLVFHELAHQLIYVSDDSVFNESFATAVEEAGLARWIASQTQSPTHAKLVAEQLRSDRLRTEFRRLTRSARQILVETYAAKTSDAEKRARKEAIFAGMLKAYEEAKAGEAGLAGFDHWFSGFDGHGPNNASIVSIALYDDKVPAFRALLAQCDGDLETFYGRVRDLAARPKAERDRTLAALVEHGPTHADAGLATRVSLPPSH